MIKRVKRLFADLVEFKADGDSNFVTGYASVFGNVDSYGDVVVRGAFAKTIADRVPKMLVKFLSSHEWEAGAVLGTVIDAREDEKGLWFKAQLSTASDVVPIKQKMIEGHLNRLSIGYRSIREREERLPDGTYVCYLDELMLYEISVVPFAANEEASIEMVKSLRSDVEMLKSKLGLSGAGEGLPPATPESVTVKSTLSEPGEPLAGNLELYKALTEQVRIEIEV